MLWYVRCLPGTQYVYAIHGYPSHSEPLQALYFFLAVQVTELLLKSLQQIHAIPIKRHFTWLSSISLFSALATAALWSPLVSSAKSEKTIYDYALKEKQCEEVQYAKNNPSEPLFFSKSEFPGFFPFKFILGTPALHLLLFDPKDFLWRQKENQSVINYLASHL